LPYSIAALHNFGAVYCSLDQTTRARRRWEGRCAGNVSYWLTILTASGGVDQL
jgi:hypothetical protein